MTGEADLRIVADTMPAAAATSVSSGSTRATQRILSLFGHEVRVAYDGPAAIRLAEEFRPRVAVLDIGMPGTNGYEVARALRERRIAPITLVALTGWGQESDRRLAMEAGFDYHLTKPVDPEALNRLFADVAKDN